MNRSRDGFVHQGDESLTVLGIGDAPFLEFLGAGQREINRGELQVLPGPFASRRRTLAHAQRQLEADCVPYRVAIVDLSD